MGYYFVLIWYDTVGFYGWAACFLKRLVHIWRPFKEGFCFGRSAAQGTTEFIQSKGICTNNSALRFQTYF